MELRDYQLDLMTKVRKSYLNGKRAPCIVLGCGGGKTVLFAYMAQKSQEKGNIVWFLVHRQELMQQTLDTFKRFNIPLNRIHIDMVQTVSRNLTKHPKPDFIIFDECHFSKAKTWQKIIDAFPKAKLAGLTATPSRLDGKPLGDIYDCMVQGLSANELIKRNYLSPYKYYAPTVADLTGIRKRGSDYDSTSSYEILGKPKIYGDVIIHWLRYAKDKQTIIYCSNIKHSEEVAEAFQNKGINAVHFDGNTPKSKRKQIIEDFRLGKIKILCNVDLISVGFDMPNVECCVLLRPTQSTALYIQQACRALRFKENKTAIILDHVANFTRHGLPDSPHEWSLDNKLKQNNSFNSRGELVVKQCEQCFGCYNSSKFKNCPYCGHVPELTIQEIENIKEIELQEIKEAREQRIKDRVSNYDDPKQCRDMDELTEYRKMKNYARGWQYYIAKEMGFIHK